MNNKGGWLGIMIVAGLSACAALSASDTPSALPYSQRLVIQFTPDRHACHAAGIAALSRATGVPLALVRSRANGSCVVNQFARHLEHFIKQQNRIAAHDSIQWVEPDRRMHVS